MPRRPFPFRNANSLGGTLFVPRLSWVLSLKSERKRAERAESRSELIDAAFKGLLHVAMGVSKTPGD
jgi:hypothetical protein